MAPGRGVVGGIIKGLWETWLPYVEVFGEWAMSFRSTVASRWALYTCVLTRACSCARRPFMDGSAEHASNSIGHGRYQNHQT